MPRKIRQLIADLEKAGFVNQGGKGSHRKFKHRNGAQLTLSGGPGEDAHYYQEKDVRNALELTREESL